MDQELVQYLDGRFQGLDQRFERIDQRFDQVDRQFERIDQRFERIDQRFEQVDRRFERIDQRFEAVDGRFDQMDGRIEEVKRHNGVLIEGLCDQVRLLADGLATHIEAEHSRHQAIQEQFRETRALIHLSYEQLHQRVENLERNRQG